jgi:hypothetical protein
MVLHKLTGCKSFWFSAADQWLGRGLGVAIGGLHGSGHFQESLNRRAGSVTVSTEFRWRQAHCQLGAADA